MIRQGRINPHSPVVCKDDHARFGSGRLFDVLYRHIVYRYIFRSAGFAVICGNGCRLEYGLFVEILAAALHDNMRAGYILCMEPYITVSCSIEGEIIVFLIIFSYQYRHPVGKGVAVRGRLVFFLFETSLLFASANIAGLNKLISDGFYFVYIICVFQESKDGLKVFNLTIVFLKLNLFFLDGGFGFAVFLKIVLGVLCRRLLNIKRYAL